VANGSAAAARILARITQGEMALEPIRAKIDEARCSGCRICNDLCPYSAIEYDGARMVTSIRTALCQGCGVCVAACPAGAIAGSSFSDAQILGQIEGLLMDASGRDEAPPPGRADSREAVPA
jgi:heterodisulfide reductase subunit A